MNMPETRSNDKLPSVQVLLSTFNGAEYIGELLDSLEAQTVRNWQVLIRDDGSDDGTETIITKRMNAEPLRYILLVDSLGHLGTSLSFGQLLKYAESPYVMFCDQDDKWMPEKIALTLRQMKKLENLHGSTTPLLVHTDMVVVSDDLKQVADSFWKHSGLNPARADNVTTLMIQNVIAGCTVMINRPARDLANPVPMEAIMHDWWVGLVVAALGKIGYLDLPTVQYRQHGKNTIGSIRYDIFYAMKKSIQGFGRHSAKESFHATCRQIFRFIDRFESCLLPEQCDILKVYVNLQKQGILRRKLTILMRGFWKTGVFRNLAWFLWV